MWSTGATPRRVSATPVYSPVIEEATARRVGDRAAIITTLNDDDSVFRVTGCAAFGAHHNAYRICGEKGQIENLRGINDKVMLRYNDWDIPEGMEAVNLYEPTWNDGEEDKIENSGHGGGDYIVARMFVECINVLSSAMISVLLSLKIFYFYFFVCVTVTSLLLLCIWEDQRLYFSFLSLPRGDLV